MLGRALVRVLRPYHRKSILFFCKCVFCFVLVATSVAVLMQVTGNGGVTRKGPDEHRDECHQRRPRCHVCAPS